MTPEKILEALDACDDNIIKYARKSDNFIEVCRDAETTVYVDQLRHARWMIRQTANFTREGRMDKAFRWLGFIQGVLWSHNIQSVETSKRQNMPEGEVFA